MRCAGVHLELRVRPSARARWRAAAAGRRRRSRRAAPTALAARRARSTVPASGARQRMAAEHVVDDRLERPRRQRGETDFEQRQRDDGERRAPGRGAGRTGSTRRASSARPQVTLRAGGRRAARRRREVEVGGLRQRHGRDAARAGVLHVQPSGMMVREPRRHHEAQLAAERRDAAVRIDHADAAVERVGDVERDGLARAARRRGPSAPPGAPASPGRRRRRRRAARRRRPW